ncbi:hypothetical protein HOM50_01125 [bacterium]|nr:hypothetical protein [bacterium]
MKRLKLLIGLVGIVLVYTIQPVPARYFRGAFQYLKPQYKLFSPIQGVSMWKSRWVRNLYNTGPDKQAMTQLLKNPRYGLFHQLPTGELRVSQQIGSPAQWIARKDLHAKLLNTLHDGTITPKERKSFVKTIKDSYAQTKEKLALQSAKPQQYAKELRSIEKKSNEFLDAVVQAKKEEALGFYKPGTVQRLIMSHLHASSMEPKVLTAYAAQLHKIRPEVGLHAALAVDDPFGKKELGIYHRALEDPDPLAARKVDPEIMIFGKESECTLSEVPTGQVKVGEKVFPDCVEASLNNLFNLILFKEGRFDLNVLPSNIQPNKQLIDFYNKMQINPDHVNQASKDKWAEVLANIPGAQYNLGDVELYGNEENILHVINYLLNTNVKSLEELGRLLSTPEHSIKINSKGEIFVDEKQASLSMDKDHAYCLYKNSSSDNRSFFVDPSIQELFPLKRVETLSDASHFIYAQDLDDPNRKLSAIEYLVGKVANKKDWRHIKDQVLALAKTLPLNDSYFMNKTFKVLSVVPGSSFDKLVKLYADKGITKADLFIGAIRNGDSEGVKSFLDKEASLIEVQEKGRSPLYYAVHNFVSTPELINTLISRGADPADAEVNTEYLANTPLYNAIHTDNPNPDLIKTLIALGADPEKAGIDEKKYENSNTPLYNAIHGFRPDPDLIKTLISLGADPEKAGIDEKIETYLNTPLYEAIHTDNPNLELIETLIALGADPEKAQVNLVRWGSEKKGSPLYQAMMAYDYNPKLVDALVSLGAELSYTDQLRVKLNRLLYGQKK